MTDGEELRKKFNVVAAAVEMLPEPEEKPWLSDWVAGALRPGPGRAGHLLLGEPHVNGCTLETYMMLAENGALFDAAAKAGVKHLALEFSVTLQPALDAYAEKKINSDELYYHLFENPQCRFVPLWVKGDADLQFREAFIATIDNALEAGLKVHFADVTAEKYLNARPPELEKLFEGLAEKHAAEKSPLPLQQYIDDYGRNMPAAEQERLAQAVATFKKDQFKARLDDKDQYDYLRSRVAAGEGILGLMGLGHLDDSVNIGAGLASRLASDGDMVVTVEIYNKRSTFEYFQADYAAKGLVKHRSPDYTIILEDDALLDKNLVPAIRRSGPAVPPGGMSPV